MDTSRLDDMLNRYGEVCSQKTAGKILNVVPRTIARMMREGRLRRVDRGVDVRSICEYIENQEEHHKNQSFRDEYIKFLELFGIDYNKDYIFY